MARSVEFYPKAINHVSPKCTQHIPVLRLCLNNGAKSHISIESLLFWKVTNLKDYSDVECIQFHANM